MKKILLICFLVIATSVYAIDEETTYGTQSVNAEITGYNYSELYNIGLGTLNFATTFADNSRYTWMCGVKHEIGAGVESVFLKYAPIEYVNLDLSAGISPRDYPEVFIAGNYSPFNKPIDLKIVKTEISVGAYVSIASDGDGDYGGKINGSVDEVAGVKVTSIVEKIFSFLKGIK